MVSNTNVLKFPKPFSKNNKRLSVTEEDENWFNLRLAEFGFLLKHRDKVSG